MEVIGPDEFVVLVVSFFFTCVFLYKWYRYLFFSVIPYKRDELLMVALCGLPIASFAIILFTLKVLASFDVVDSPLFITFYVVLGFVWLHFSLYCMFRFFDLSWIDDVMIMNNKSALTAIAGGALGSVFIYAGANIGDGPGWWCVIFAGGLGLMTWILLGVGIARTNEMSERITVERDLGCGIRFGSYLLASGIILGRASGGDWTSFYMTVVEFYDVYDRWPVLLLAALEAIVENFYSRRNVTRGNKDTVNSSIFWGAVYIIFAVIIVMQLWQSLPQNPFYREDLRYPVGIIR